MIVETWRDACSDAIRAPRRGEIHLVRASLACRADGRVEELRALLSPDERARARRLRRLEDDARYAASRGILRELLAALTGLDPRAIAYARSPLGKPRLRGAEAIRFSMSASGSEALYAFAIDREVGVDVERIDARLADPDAPVLPRVERERIAALDPALRPRAFFEVWTRTEAILKAAGTGLGEGDAARDGAGMTVIDCGFSPAYAAALAAPGSGFSVSAWVLREDARSSRAA